jgi:hypothetical protein
MENETVIQKVNRLHKEVVGFDKIDKCKQEDIEVYLQYNSEELKELTENECELISIKLLQHSLYVQRKLNCIKAAQDWLLYELRKIISRDIQNIKGVSWENAEQIVINANPIAITMQENIQNYKVMLSTGYNIVNILDNFSKRIDSIKFSKKGK